MQVLYCGCFRRHAVVKLAHIGSICIAFLPTRLPLSPPPTCGRLPSGRSRRCCRPAGGPRRARCGRRRRSAPAARSAAAPGAAAAGWPGPGASIRVVLPCRALEEEAAGPPGRAGRRRRGPGAARRRAARTHGRRAASAVTRWRRGRSRPCGCGREEQRGCVKGSAELKPPDASKWSAAKPATNHRRPAAAGRQQSRARARAPPPPPPPPPVITFRGTCPQGAWAARTRCPPRRWAKRGKAAAPGPAGSEEAGRTRGGRQCCCHMPQRQAARCSTKRSLHTLPQHTSSQVGLN